MKRIHHESLLAPAGILLMFASAIPTIFQPSGPFRNDGQEHSLSPRAASYVDYLYTIGNSTNYGSDNTKFYVPNAVAANSTGHVFIADTGNNREQVFDKAGHYCRTIGIGTAGQGNDQFDE